MRVATSIVLVLLSPMVAAAVGPLPKPVRAGQIIVVGNEATPTEAILWRCEVWPGIDLDANQLRRTELEIRRIPYLRTISVSVLDNPANPTSQYKDILITVEERPTAFFFWGALEMANASNSYRQREKLATNCVMVGYFWFTSPPGSVPPRLVAAHLAEVVFGSFGQGIEKMRLGVELIREGSRRRVTPVAPAGRDGGFREGELLRARDGQAGA
jgi:hypothetical protein